MAHVELYGAHSRDAGPADVAFLIVDEHAGIRRQAQRIQPRLIGAPVRLQDAGISRIDNDLEIGEDRQPPALEIRQKETKVRTACSTSWDWLNLPEKSRPAKTKTF